MSAACYLGAFVRLLVLTRYGRLGASSRLRSYQYVPHLVASGVDLHIAPMLGDDYVSGLYAGRVPVWSVLQSYLARITSIVGATGYDVVWVEKEMLPWVPAFIEIGLLHRSIPLVADFDDAAFHRYDLHHSTLVRGLLGQKIDQVMRRAALVLVGNEYLADRARKAGASRVEYIPTVVDTERYSPIAPCEHTNELVVGWIGSPATVKHLRAIGAALQGTLGGLAARVVAVGANPEQLTGLSIEARPWSERTEVDEVRSFDIGIMPLPDEPFERGKCGYKLIQYMACGKPVVASPVGVNSSIVEHGVNGFLATSPSEWQEALSTLAGDPELRERMGMAGRKQVEAHYSLGVTAPRVEALLRSVLD